jgi:hypothetical protein
LSRVLLTTTQRPGIDDFNVLDKNSFEQISEASVRKEEMSSAGGDTDRKKSENLEFDICFWDLNPKNHLASRLKAIQLYESANIFLMVYNADDRDSFDKLNSILLDFKDSNAVGAYKVLVSVIN